MNTAIYEITDDTGYLALVDHAAYTSFVDENWTVAQLQEHFKAQMIAKHLLLWRTGREDVWRVQVSIEATGARGFREIASPIVVTAGRLLLTNYDSLSMAASFRDVKLPETYQQNLVLNIPAGEYRCRIVQALAPSLFGNEVSEIRERASADFFVELVTVSESLPPWKNVPWT
jgi:hypothetical protein